MERVIVHKIFEECSKYTLDEFWAGVFLDCSEEKYPKGFWYNAKKSYITYPKKRSKKRETFNITPNMGIEEIFQKCMEIFRENIGLMSPHDVEVFKEEGKKEEDEIKTWKSIRKKAIREKLTLEYVKKLGEEHGFNLLEMKSLYDQLRLGQQLKKIVSTDITLENNSIVEIKNMKLDVENRIFVFSSDSE